MTFDEQVCDPYYREKKLLDRIVPISTRDANSVITAVGGLVEVQVEVLDEDLTRNVEGDLVRRVTRNRYFRVLYHKV